MLDTQRNLKAQMFKFDAPVNSAVFSKDGSVFAFGLGDGNIHLVGNDRKTLKMHGGAVPALRAYQDGFISISDDGTLKMLSKEGIVTSLSSFGGAWTETLAVHNQGSIAVPVGKNIHLWTKADSEPKMLGPHDGSVTDVCFAPDGLGLVASHRNGATLWSWPHYEPQALPLAWKGAHLSVTISRDKRWVVTAMQEGALHMWNLALKRDYQMRGYWTKPTSLAWSADGKWLATSGSETVILWPFDKQGPEGREPLQLGWSNATFVTKIAAHADDNVMAAGFEDGALVMLDIPNKKAFNASAPSGHAITALAFSPQGQQVLAGTANGGGVLLDFA